MQNLRTYNICFFSFIVAAHIFVLFILPIYLLPLSAWWAVSIIPFMLIHSMQWGLIHEAIHKNLDTNRSANEYGGRALSALMGVSFAVLRFGHLMHHKLNRQWQSEKVDKVSIREKISYYYNLLGGLYITEAITTILIALLPKNAFLGLAKRTSLAGNDEVFPQGERFFYQKENITSARTDFALIALMYTASFAAYGVYFPLLILFIVSRAVMISFFDNLYHYGTSDDKAGKNLRLSRGTAFLILNSNYHETHHLSPHTPWISLPQEHMQKGQLFAGKFTEHALLQFKGPIKATAV